MASPNEIFTSSFSVQNVSGSIYAFLRYSATGYTQMKYLGGSVGQGTVQVGFQIDPTIIAAFTSALSGAAAAGTGSYTYG